MTDKQKENIIKLFNEFKMDYLCAVKNKTYLKAYVIRQSFYGAFYALSTLHPRDLEIPKLFSQIRVDFKNIDRRYNFSSTSTKIIDEINKNFEVEQ